MGAMHMNLVKGRLPMFVKSECCCQILASGMCEQSNCNPLAISRASRHAGMLSLHPSHLILALAFPASHKVKRLDIVHCTAFIVLIEIPLASQFICDVPMLIPTPLSPSNGFFFPSLRCVHKALYGGNISFLNTCGVNATHRHAMCCSFLHPWSIHLGLCDRSCACLSMHY